MNVEEMNTLWQNVLKQHRLTFVTNVTGSLSSLYDRLETLVPTQASYSDPEMKEWIHMVHFTDKQDPSALYQLINRNDDSLAFLSNQQDEMVFYFNHMNPHLLYLSTFQDAEQTQLIQPFIMALFAFVSTCIPTEGKKG